MTEGAKSRDTTPQRSGGAEENWAKPVSELHVGHELPPDAVNLNVEGHRPASLMGGFGKMWQTKYWIHLPPGPFTPEDVIKAWKENFPSLWPKGAQFFGPMSNMTPGDVALINLKMPGRVTLSTGIRVIYSDDVSFSFQTPEGHQFNSMITFSAREEDGHVVAEAQANLRTQDPIAELGMMLGGHRMEDRHWKHVLESLARHLGVEATASKSRKLIDRRRQWKNFGNIRHTAALSSLAYSLKHPFRRRG